MRSVTSSMGVSLDGYIVGPNGYIVGPNGDFDWTAPDEEVFRFVTDARAIDDPGRERASALTVGARSRA